MEIIALIVAFIEFVIIHILTTKIYENEEYINYQSKQLKYLHEENENLISVIKESDKQIKKLKGLK